jgi:hypothetical protein
LDGAWFSAHCHRDKHCQNNQLKHIFQSCYAAVWFWCYQYTKRFSIREGVIVFPFCIFCKRCLLGVLSKFQWTYNRCISWMTYRFLRRTREALKQTSLRHSPFVSVFVSVLCCFQSYSPIWIVLMLSIYEKIPDNWAC